MPVPETVPLSLQERLTKQFYEWEIRGRGWRLWDYNVPLEPPFRPFLFHHADPGPAIDDGRLPNGLVEFAKKLVGFGSVPATTELVPASQDDPAIQEESAPPEYYTPGNPVEIRITLPPDADISQARMEQFLLNLSSCNEHLAFEIIGTSSSIGFQIACRPEDEAAVTQRIRTHFPEAVITADYGVLANLWHSYEDTQSAAVHFALSKEFMRPVKTCKGFDIDPLLGFVGPLSDLRE